MGPVKTPYNKHELIGSLTERLSREETRRRIRARIDDDDRLLLSAAAILGQPTESVLFQFLEDQFDYGRFRWLVANHRDRLLLIDGIAPDTVLINPVLGDEFHQEVLVPERLIAGRALEQSDREAIGETPWFSRIFVAALYAFLREEPELYTRSGVVRKRVAVQLARRFGPLLDPAENSDRLNVAIGALETLGLVTSEKAPGVTRLQYDAWDEMSELPDNWIQALLWAALFTDSLETSFEIAQHLMAFSADIPPDHQFTDVEIVRILRLTGNGMALPFDRRTPSQLAETGLLIARDNQYSINPAAKSLLATGNGNATGAAVHANMEITVPPDLTFRALLDLARLAYIRRFDVMPVFELTETGITSAAREDRDSAGEILYRITATDLPQNVEFLIERWCSRAGAVRLIQGLVLVVTVDVAEILELADDFREHVLERLAPGAFLVRPDREEEISRLLNRLEVGSAGAVERPRNEDAGTPDYRRFFLRHQQPALSASRPLAFSEPIRKNPSQPLDPDDYPQHLHGLLADENLPEEVNQELALRIDRKLILFAEQIRPDIIPQYGIEAHGLDYVGKIRVAEKAIQDEELLEIIMRDTDGTPQRMMVKPREIKESSGDLMLRAIQLPGQTPVRIRIRRASLVRRLSGTLLRRRR